MTLLSPEEVIGKKLCGNDTNNRGKSQHGDSKKILLHLPFKIRIIIPIMSLLR